MSTFFYLASQSPRRRQILDELGAQYKILDLEEGSGDSSDFDETPLANEIAVDYVRRVSLLKARAGWAQVLKLSLDPNPVLSADTTVVFDDLILGKPESRDHAIEMLQRLQSCTHKVHSCVTVKYQDQEDQALSTTEVTLAPLSKSDIVKYVDSGEPFGKAGSYGIQGRAGLFVQKIEGSYTGVVGLPIYETAELLKRFDYDLL